MTPLLPPDFHLKLETYEECITFLGFQSRPYCYTWSIDEKSKAQGGETAYKGPKITPLTQFKYLLKTKGFTLLTQLIL